MTKSISDRTEELFKETETVSALFAQRENGSQQYVPLQNLVPNRFNPRQAYSREGLNELIESIQTYGFIGALDGRRLPDGRVELAYGSRRLLAAKAASLQTLPVFIHNWNDDQMRFIALVENLAREDLTPVDEANTVGHLHEDLDMSTREISRRIGKPRSWVQDRLALYRAPQDVKDMVEARTDTLRVARFLARIDDEESRRILQEKVLRQEITTRHVQQAVQQLEQGLPIGEALVVALTPPEQLAPAALAGESGAEDGDESTAMAEAVRTAEADVEPLPATSSDGPPSDEAHDAEAMTSFERASDGIPEQRYEQDLDNVDMPAASVPQPPPIDLAEVSPDWEPSKPMPTSSSRGWFSGVQLLGLALDALTSFSIETTQGREMGEILRLLDQLSARIEEIRANLDGLQ